MREYILMQKILTVFGTRPEEANRQLMTQITAYHFAPTIISRDNLIRESVNDGSVAVTEFLWSYE